MPGVGAIGQARLTASQVLVVGAGGLGCTVIPALAAAGVGRLTIIDPDQVEMSNLHRQTLYSLADIGQPKALAAAARARVLNPECQAKALMVRLDPANGPGLIAGADLVVDAAGCAAMIARLIPRAALVTPNLPEAARLTGLQSGAAMGALASGFFAMGAQAVLLKGGHASGAEAVDWLLRPDAAPLRFANLRKPGSRHGTGCTLTSAIAIHLARGVDLATDCAQAKCYLSAWL